MNMTHDTLGAIRVSDPAATGGVERERDIITDENAAAGGLFLALVWVSTLSLSLSLSCITRAEVDGAKEGS